MMQDPYLCLVAAIGNVLGVAKQLQID